MKWFCSDRKSCEYWWVFSRDLNTGGDLDEGPFRCFGSAAEKSWLAVNANLVPGLTRRSWSSDLRQVEHWNAASLTEKTGTFKHFIAISKTLKLNLHCDVLTPASASLFYFHWGRRHLECAFQREVPRIYFGLENLFYKSARATAKNIFLFYQWKQCFFLSRLISISPTVQQVICVFYKVYFVCFRTSCFLFACLSVSRITQKQVNRYTWNLVGGQVQNNVNKSIVVQIPREGWRQGLFATFL